MPDKETMERAEEDKREGKAPGTQAGEFIREGKHGAVSTKQAIAIGLSKARRAGVKLRAPKKGTASAATRRKAARDLRRGKSRRKPSRTRARAVRKTLRHEGHRAASRKALSRQAHRAASRRSAASRSRSARKAAATRKRK